MGSKQSKPVPVSDVSTSTSGCPVQNVKNDKNESDQLKNNNMPNDSIHNKLNKLTGNESSESSDVGGGCPMKKNGGGYLGGGWLFGGKKEANDVTDVTANSTTANNDSADNSESACPVMHKKGSNNNNKNVEYNVYSQPIDPSNNMPSVANNLPSPMQKQELSTTRVKSTIPKGSGGNNNNGTNNNNDNDDDTKSTWTYPSPQMFYNSLARKNKLGDTTEEDIESVVALHNNMNEKTWAKVMEWEQVICDSSTNSSTNSSSTSSSNSNSSPSGIQSKLLKFMGRPSDLSPKAQIKNLLFNHPLPFDRHDWTIIRQNGQEVRYIIDYYYDESQASEDDNSGLPNMDDRDAVKSILVDVRPAVDSVESVVSRIVTMPMARHLLKSTDFEPLPMIPTNDLKTQVLESEKVWANIQQNVQESKKKVEINMILTKDDIPVDQREDTHSHDSHTNDESLPLPEISDEEAKEIALSFSTMLSKCIETQQKINNCQNEKECAQASLAMTMCLAKVVCPVQQKAVAQVLDDDDHVDRDDDVAVEEYNARFDKVLENMAICVNAKSEKAAIARQTHPHLFSNEMDE